MSKVLTKDQILQADDIVKELVHVPEWGGTVYVKAMTETEYSYFEEQILSDKNKSDMSNVRAKLCAMSIVDKAGSLLFSPEDILVLSKKSVKAINRIFKVAQSLNIEDVEELVKNSVTTQEESSSSD